MSVAPAQAHRPGGPRQPVVQELHVCDLNLTGQAHVGERAGKDSADLAAAHDRLRHDLGEVVDDKVHRQTGRGLLGRIGWTARCQTEVFGLQAGVQVIERRLALVGPDHDLGLRSQGVGPTAGPARLLQHQACVHPPARLGPGALGRERGVAAGSRRGGQSAAGRRAGHVHSQCERLVGRQAQTAGDAPAFDLLRIRVELESALAPQVEIGLEKVARAQDAAHVQRRDCAPMRLLYEFSGQVVGCAGLTEGGLGQDAGLQLVELYQDIGRVAAIRLRRQDRLAEQYDLAGGQRLHVHALEQQLPGAPADSKPVRLDPHAFGVAHGQALDGEVA